MIDIHTHILPGVDDGARTFLDALKLIELEKDRGVDTIILTPHYNKRRGYLSNYEDNITIYNTLISKLKEQNIDLNIYLGNEIYPAKDIPDLLTDNVITSLGNSKYVLLDTPLNSIDNYLEECIYELILTGYKPIIAHPERALYISNDLSEIKLWKSLGALIQVNMGSLTGTFGKKAKRVAHKIIKEDLVFCIASDCHGKYREPDLLSIYKYISKKYSVDKAELLLYINPLMIINEINGE